MIEKLRDLYKKHRQIILYVFFGGCTTLVGVGTFILFDTALHIHELLANAYSWLLAVGFAYVTNRRWVFCSRAKGRELGKEILAFYSGRLLTLALEEGLLLVLVTWLSFSATAVKIAGQVAVVIGNYLISKIFVFHKK